MRGRYWVAFSIMATFGFWLVGRQERLQTERMPANPYGSCIDAKCHAGIEDPHPLTLPCVRCHGGDDRTTDKDRAHVSNAKTLTNVDWAIPAVIEQLPRPYVRFVNPGDLRVAVESCGHEVGCHGGGPRSRDDIVPRVASSLHSTLAGYNALRVQFGAKTTGDPPKRADFTPLFGIVPAAGRSPVASAGTTATSLKAFREAVEGGRASPESIVRCVFARGTLQENCSSCHLNAYGANDRAGHFRSSGCSACHFTYARNGHSESRDAAVARAGNPRGHGRFPHPLNHQMSRIPGDDSCRACHLRGTRIQQNYEGADPMSGVRSERYSSDLHFTAGLSCVDCHTERDLHGDGQIYARQTFAIEIRCVDCHGTLDRRAGAQTRRGRRLSNLVLRQDGTFYLRLKKTDRLIPVPQIRDSLSAESLKFNRQASIAHGRWDDDPANGLGCESNIKGFTHLDRVACQTCHSTWTHQSVGTQYRVDYSRARRDLLTSATSSGVSACNEDFRRSQDFVLGLSHEGMITPVVAQHALVTVTDENGRLTSEKKALSKSGSITMLTYAPVTPHTTQKKALVCVACHLREDGGNSEAVALRLGLPEANNAAARGGYLQAVKASPQPPLSLVSDPRQMSGDVKPMAIINAPGYRPLDTTTALRALRVRIRSHLPTSTR